MFQVHFHPHCIPGSAASPICDRGSSISFLQEIRPHPFPLSRIFSLALSPHPVSSSSTPSLRKRTLPCFDKPRTYVSPVRRRVLTIIFFPWHQPNFAIDLTSCTSFVYSLLPTSQSTHLLFPESGFQKIQTRIAAWERCRTNPGTLPFSR